MTLGARLAAWARLLWHGVRVAHGASVAAAGVAVAGGELAVGGLEAVRARAAVARLARVVALRVAELAVGLAGPEAQRGGGGRAHHIVL